MLAGRPAPRCFSARQRQPPRLSSVRCSSGAAAGPSYSDVTVADTYERLNLINRKLSVAVADEDYALAAKLRDESKALLSGLPPVTQYMYHQISQLRVGPTLQDKLAAITKLGEVGDDAVVPELASCLGSEPLVEAAQDAMWAVFMRCRDPVANEKLGEAVRLMQQSSMQYQQALERLEEVIKMAPSFAEGYNKRATLYYIMQRYKESIDDCKTVLQLQPYHYGAASGMGLCHVQLGEFSEAVSAFDTALRIHPGMKNIRRLMDDLKRQLEAGKETADAKQQQDSSQGGDS